MYNDIERKGYGETVNETERDEKKGRMIKWCREREPLEYPPYSVPL